MAEKLHIYPGINHWTASFFYKEFELYPVSDITMFRSDVIAYFECRLVSVSSQCQYKLFIVGTNNRGVK